MDYLSEYIEDFIQSLHEAREGIIDGVYLLSRMFNEDPITFSIFVFGFLLLCYFLNKISKLTDKWGVKVDKEVEQKMSQMEDQIKQKEIQENQKIAYTKKTERIKAGKIELAAAKLRVHYFEKHKQTLGKKWTKYSKLVADEKCFWNFIKIIRFHSSSMKSEEWLLSMRSKEWLSSKEALHILQEKYVPFHNYCKKESRQEDVNSYYSVPRLFNNPEFGGRQCSKCQITYGLELIKEEISGSRSYAKHKNKDGSADLRYKNNSKSYSVYDRRYKCYECSAETEFREVP
jgi:hypothetical protein